MSLGIPEGRVSVPGSVFPARTHALLCRGWGAGVEAQAVENPMGLRNPAIIGRWALNGAGHGSDWADMQHDIIQLVYVSAASVPFSDGDLAQLLAQSRAANHGRDVGGCLLYESGSFMQILEGDEPVVLGLYEHIAQDPRHTNTSLVLKRLRPEREFSDWKMGFLADAKELVEALDGFDDFFSRHRGFSGLTSDDGRVQDILAAFRSGRWRRKVR